MNGLSGAIKVEDTPLEQAVLSAIKMARTHVDRQGLSWWVGPNAVFKVHATLNNDDDEALNIRIVRKPQ